MNQIKKVKRLLENIDHEDLSAYEPIYKAIKKHLPIIGGTKRFTLALLKEFLGDIKRIDVEEIKNLKIKNDMESRIVFEDVKDGKVRIFINIGKNHKITPGDLIREISKRSGIDGKLVGKIDIYSNYSFIEIPEQFAELVLVSLDKAKMKGMSIVAEPAKKRKKTK